MHQIVKKIIAVVAICALAVIAACGKKKETPQAERRPLEITHSVTDVGTPPVRIWHYSAPVLCKPKDFTWVSISGVAQAPDSCEKVRQVVEEAACYLLEDRGWELFNNQFSISNPSPSPKVLHCHITIEGRRDGTIRICVQSKVDAFYGRYFQIESFYSRVNKDYLPVLAERLDKATKQAREMAKAKK